MVNFDVEKIRRALSAAARAVTAEYGTVIQRRDDFLLDYSDKLFTELLAKFEEKTPNLLSLSMKYLHGLVKRGVIKARRHYLAPQTLNSPIGCWPCPDSTGPPKHRAN